MTWPSNKIGKKPDGMYRASVHETSCDFCAYYLGQGHCSVRQGEIFRPHLYKCRDWCDRDAGIPDSSELPSNPAR